MLTRVRKAFRNLYCPITLRDLWWAVRGVLFDRHDVIVVPTLPATWTDTDEKLLHASFHLLCQFVERECVREKACDEAWALYTWWKQRPYRQWPDIAGCSDAVRFEATVDDRGYRCYRMEADDETRARMRAFGDKSDHYYAEDTNMLVRLVRVRGELWT